MNNELRKLIKQAVSSSSSNLAKELNLKQLFRYEPVRLITPDGPIWVVWENEINCWVEGMDEFTIKAQCQSACDQLNARKKQGLNLKKEELQVFLTSIIWIWIENFIAKLRSKS